MAIDRTLTKIRTYTFDPRHIAPLARDVMELTAGCLFDARRRRQVINVGRDMRQRAFDARDPMPVIEFKDLGDFLGVAETPAIVIPPIEAISLAGLGFAAPYTILGAIVGALQPERIWETGTFRGVSALTMALNAPKAEIFTLDLPPDLDDADTSTLTKGDKEWVRIVRGSVGVAFHGHPAEARIHQLLENSLTFDAKAAVGHADFCFIDGGHSYECVAADTRNALSILRPGGVILWDDYTWFMDGVRDFLQEFSRGETIHRLGGTQYIIYRKT